MITIRLKATPSNVTIIQVYAHASDYRDAETDELSEQLHNGIEQVTQKDILIVKGNWNAKVGADATTIWNGISGTGCNTISNDRGLRLVEFAHSNYLILVKTFGQTSIHGPMNTITKVTTL